MANGPKLPKIAGARPKLPKVPSMPVAGTRPTAVRAPSMRVTIPTRRKP